MISKFGNPTTTAPVHKQIPHSYNVVCLTNLPNIKTTNKWEEVTCKQCLKDRKYKL